MKKGFIFALESEFNAFKSHLNETFTYQDPYYFNQDQTLVVMISGVGKSYAAMATTQCLLDHSLDLIINVGVAGGVGQKKGDVILVKKTMFHDVNVVAFGYHYGELPASPLFFKPEPNAYQRLIDTAEAMGQKIILGTVATGDQFVENLDQLYQAIEMDKDIKAVEMELSSIALVAHKHKTPWVALKAISDEVGNGKQTDDFNKMISKAMKPISLMIQRAFLNDH
jgi:adenosylhomocysteine nucleosidase